MYNSLQTICSSICIIILALSGPKEARASQTNQPCRIDSKNIKKWGIWGATTNKIGAGIEINYDAPLIVGRYLKQGRSVLINVYVRRYGHSLSVSFPGTNFVTNVYQLAPHYMGATNLFCGPIELLSADGKKMPLLKPEVSALGSYPSNFHYIKLYKNWRRQLKKGNFTLSPMPGNRGLNFLVESRQAYLLKSFYLHDYFNIDQAGKYKLTVWPKIYEQSETNKDLYQRIDIPPVTVNIQWNGKE